MSDIFDEAMLLYSKAVEFYSKQEFDDVIYYTTQAISIFPDIAPVYNLRGNAYYGKKEYKKSIDDQTMAINLTEIKEKEIQNEKTNYDNNEIKKIIDELTKSKAHIYFNRGNAYDDINDFENAEKDFSESIKLNPEFPNVYNSRGIVYDKNGDYISAIEDFSKAIEMNYEKIVFAYNNRAQAFEHLERYEEAISDCQKAIEIDPVYTHAYNTLGLVYKSRGEEGDKDNALLSFNRAIAIDPNYKEPQNNKKNINIKPKKIDTSTSVSFKHDDRLEFLEE